MSSSLKTDGRRGIIGIEEEVSNERILKSYRVGQGTVVRFGGIPNYLPLRKTNSAPFLPTNTSPPPKSLATKQYEHVEDEVVTGER